MIPCTEFIPIYGMLFGELERLGGFEKVMEYWDSIAAKNPGLQLLGRYVREEGIRGCYRYWSHTLNEEAADFSMTVDEEAGTFVLDMHVCPSKKRVMQCSHVQPYPHYCKHCDILYRRVLEPLGYRYDYDMSRCDQAACKLTVTDMRRHARATDDRQEK